MELAGRTGELHVAPDVWRDLHIWAAHELERDRLNAPSLRIVVSEWLAPGSVAAFEPMPSLLERLPRALDPLFDPLDGGGRR